jgi:hypothetical protein
MNVIGAFTCALLSGNYAVSHGLAITLLVVD